MRRSLRLYLAFLFSIVICWTWLRLPAIASFARDVRWGALAGIIVLYLCSHFLRMLRLALLTLDERQKVFPLIAAHTLTAFPSSFLPFKLGELLRLGAFLQIYENRQKGLAVWLAERFGDILVITAFILWLYLFDIKVPPAMRTVFILFAFAGIFGLLGLFAVAKVFVYLNRHLVLTSHTPRGLVMLRASHALRCLEGTIYKSVEGRLSGFLLLSTLIWSVEIVALSLFINQLAIDQSDFAAFFASGLLASLPGGGAGLASFGLYQSIALVFLTIVFLLAVWFAMRFKLVRI
jgi:hypothetical protein